jgi:hypothetical protein
MAAREGEAAAWSEHAARLGERGCRVGHEHVATPAEDAVDRVVLELDALGVHDAVLDVRQAELLAAAARDIDHRRAEVRADDSPALADGRGGRVAGVPEARRELEDRVARAHRKLADHPLANGERGRLDRRAPLLPSGRHRLPGLVRLPAVLLAGHQPIVDADRFANRVPRIAEARADGAGCH